MQWLPHSTVATIVKQNDKYLLVEERSNGQLVYNQPAGHLEADETLIEAAVRETLEETGWTVQIQGIVGVALYKAPSNNVTYHRTTFAATALSHDPERPLDTDIERAIWLSYEEMLAASDKMRSELVIKSVEQYQNGHLYPLSLFF